MKLPKKVVDELNQLGWEVVKDKSWKTREWNEDAWRTIYLGNAYIKIRNKETGETRSYKAWEVFDYGWVVYRGQYVKKNGDFEFVKYYKEKYGDNYSYEKELRGEYDDEVDRLIRSVFVKLPAQL